MSFWGTKRECDCSSVTSTFSVVYGDSVLLKQMLTIAVKYMVANPTAT